MVFGVLVIIKISMGWFKERFTGHYGFFLMSDKTMEWEPTTKMRLSNEKRDICLKLDTFKWPF